MAQAAGPSTLTYQPHVLASVLRSICVTTRCLLGEAWAPVPGAKLSFELVAAYAHGPGPVRVHVKTEAGPAFTQTLDASFIRANKKSHTLALRLCEDTVERGTVVYSYSELDTDAMLRALEYRFHTALAVPVTLDGAVVAIFVLFASQPLNVSAIVGVGRNAYTLVAFRHLAYVTANKKAIIGACCYYITVLLFCAGSIAGCKALFALPGKQMLRLLRDSTPLACQPFSACTCRFLSMSLVSCIQQPAVSALSWSGTSRLYVPLRVRHLARCPRLRSTPTSFPASHQPSPQQ